MDQKYEDLMVKLVEMILEGNDYMPKMYEGMKCYVFDIDYKKN